MDTARELGRFLASRRARLHPDDLDLPKGVRRRVPGLRREEVALVAGVSVEYYTRLEQGRTGTPSRDVMDALARALLLDESERRHVADLTGWTVTESQPPVALPRAALTQLVAQLHDVAAMVINHRFDVLVWNHLSARLFRDFGAMAEPQRNLAWYLFCDPEARRRYLEWDDLARATAAQLRMASSHHRDDRILSSLVAELRTRADDFDRYWRTRDVQERTHGSKRLWHPDVGELTLSFENFTIPDADGVRLVTFHAAPDTSAADKLTLLGIRQHAHADQPPDATPPSRTGLPNR
ncbi:MAG: transcriptional regulator [Pseudonocardiales bacterium]|nr:MAG: transcriptional regulator [Pseudonocardiales bacterium]